MPAPGTSTTVAETDLHCSRCGAILSAVAGKCAQCGGAPENGEPDAVEGKPVGKTQPSALLLLVLILAATAMPFLAALRYGFVYDDDVQVLDNIAARAAQSPMTYFVTSIWTLRNSAIPASDSYYRPLFYSWLRLNVAMFGDRPMWWHAAAILIHLAATSLVFLLILHYVRDPWSATVGALIFGVHPVHIESVVWISGVTDPLMSLGVLGSFLLWLRRAEKPGVASWIGPLACYAAALLCKETAVVLPVIVFVHALFMVRPRQQLSLTMRNRIWAAVRETLPFIAATMIYFGVRTAVLKPLRVASPPWISNWRALLTVPSLFMFYMRQLVWPLNLRLFYQFSAVESAESVRFWGALIAIGLLAACIVLAFRRRPDMNIPAAAAWFVVPLLPVLDIALFHLDDFAHDRYLYLPSVGLAIFCGVAAGAAMRGTPSPRSRLITIASVTLLVAALAASTATQSVPWQNNLSLYSHAAQNSTNSMAQMNLASEYEKRGRLKEAKQLLEPVVRERRDFWLANYNLGIVDYQLKDLDAAEPLFDRAIALNPRDPDAYMGRGMVFLRKGRLADATAMMRDAIALKPAGEGYHFALALALMLQRDPQAAKSELREELKFYPASGLAQAQLDSLERAVPDTKSADAPARNR